MKSAKKFFLGVFAGVFAAFAGFAEGATGSESRVSVGSPRPSARERGGTESEGSWLLMEVGGTELYSSYLSPLVYRGWSVAAEGVWRRPLGRRGTPRGSAGAPEGAGWEMEFRGKLELGKGMSPAGNSGMWEAQGRFSWGAERVWSTGRWRFGAGGAVGVTGGVLYLRRNSNNPAAAIARLDLSLTGRGEFRTSLCGKALVLFERLAVPSASVFFSPEYGETYYEIWLGNRKGLVNGGWWGNDFGIDSLLGAEWKLGARWLTVGWRSELQSSWAHSINTRIWRNAAVVGLRF